MTVFTLLIGIVIAAAVFAALLWSIYRLVTVKGRLRVNYAILALSTLLVVAAVTWNFAALSMTAGLTCAASGLIAMWADKGWNKLLPFVQVLLGLLSMGASAYIVF